MKDVRGNPSFQSIFGIERFNPGSPWTTKSLKPLKVLPRGRSSAAILMVSCIFRSFVL
jgi:hypothetical protein